MKNKKLIIITALTVTILVAAGTVAGAMYKDKDIVVSKDVSKDISFEKSTIDELMALGDKVLQDKKYDDAKEIFKKVISKEVTRVDTYTTIIDKYEKLKRVDDAYYFTNLAIKNNVDKENMNKKLEEIKKNFEVTKITKTVKDTDKFILPKTEKININGEPKEVEITWEKNVYDYSKKGKYVVNGEAKDYDRKVELTIEVTGKLSIEEAKELLKNDNNWRYEYYQTIHLQNVEYLCFKQIYNPNGEYLMKEDKSMAINVETKEIYYYVDNGYLYDKLGNKMGRCDEQKAMDQEKLKYLQKMTNTDAIVECGVIIKINDNTYSTHTFELGSEDNYIGKVTLQNIFSGGYTIFYRYEKVEERKTIDGINMENGETAIVFTGMRDGMKKMTLVYVLNNDKSKVKCYMRYDEDSRPFDFIGEGGITGYYFE